MKSCPWFAGLFLFLMLTGLSAQQRPLTFTDMFEMGRVSAATISPDGKWAAYSITQYNVENQNSSTTIHLVSLDGKQHKQLTASGQSASSPQWSPDGKSLAFLSSRGGSSQVYRLPLAGGEAQQITNIPTGVNSYIWAPDGRHLAVTTSMFPQASSPQASVEIGKARAEDGSSGRLINGLLYRHWNSWREDLYSHVLVVTLKDGSVRALTGGAFDSPPISLGSSHDVAFSPDSRTICFVQNRDKMVATSTNNDLWLIDRSGGTAEAISPSKGNDSGPGFSPDGRYLAYKSMARAGFEADQNDLMLYDRQSGQTTNLTGALDRYVSDFLWSPDSKHIYFYVPHHGRHRIYQVRLKNGRIKLLSDKRYVGGMAITPDGKSLVVRHQRADMPYELFRMEIKNSRWTQLTFTNRLKLGELEMNPVEDYWFTGAKGDSVHMLMIKPPGFDPAKKYPLLELIHGGPQGAWGDDFHYRWNSELFAAPGYVVIMINFHGSRGYGQAFCDAVSKDWGGAPYQDIMIGTRWAIDNFDFIDGDKVGAAGASYGGFMINWIAGHDPDNLFKTMVCHAGVFEQHSMFGATEELWFPMWEFNGVPWEEGSLYDKWNPADHVDNFNTPMLVVHGEHDYRVPYTQGLQLFTALQVKGVDSQMLFFPDEDHFVRKPRNARQWWRTVHGWIGKYLMPAPDRPERNSEPVN